jgi:hypothetical protein
MNSPWPLSRSALWAFCCCATFLHPPSAQADEFVAVSSTVSNGYVREKLPDGSFAPETYTFREGGFLSNRMADDTIDKMTFESVAHTIAGPLAMRNYVPSVDPKAARLLIVVYWGTSRAQGEFSPHTTIGQSMEQNSPVPPAHQNGFVPFWYGASAAEAQEFADKMINEEDAMMLGYPSATDPDLKEYRYFVVLLAYDMQALMRDRKEKLLWQTRFSMNEHRNRFDMQLKPMAIEASSYFGQDSLGLRRDPVLEGRVEIGKIESMDTMPEPNPSAVLAPDGAHVAYLLRGEHGMELGIGDIDRQEFHSAGDLSGFNGRSVQLEWLDSGRIAIRFNNSELLVFNDQGRRVDFDPRSINPSFAGPIHAIGDDPSAGQVRTLAEGKLPDRKVVVLASDNARHRYLLIASDQAGVGRFFVYDRPNDLLYEIGRGTSTQ